MRCGWSRERWTICRAGTQKNHNYEPPVKVAMLNPFGNLTHFIWAAHQGSCGYTYLAELSLPRLLRQTAPFVFIPDSDPMLFSSVNITANMEPPRERIDFHNPRSLRSRRPIRPERSDSLRVMQVHKWSRSCSAQRSCRLLRLKLRQMCVLNYLHQIWGVFREVFLVKVLCPCLKFVLKNHVSLYKLTKMQCFEIHLS